MNAIEIYDPPMCCSSGVCGTDPDPEMIRFSADLDWIRKQGVEVRRYNLAQEPTAFVANASVKQVLEASDVAGLPAIVVNGEMVTNGAYPSRGTLAQWAGISDVEENTDMESNSGNTLVTPEVAELIALGAAIASNCEACFKHHYNEARKMNVSKDDMIDAVNIALRVKESPAQMMVQLAQKYLIGKTAAAGGCCGDSAGGCCC